MDNQNENQSMPGFTFEAHADNPYQLREVLNVAQEKITELFDRVNATIYREQREQAFIRYCFTGKFE